MPARTREVTPLPHHGNSWKGLPWGDTSCRAAPTSHESERELRYMHYLLQHWLVSLAGTLFLGLSAMVLHEFGHLVTSLMVGIKVKSVGLCMKGMYIRSEE